MSEMVERVARAIYYGPGVAEWHPELPDHIKERARRDARAAIQAMRTPTEEMLEIGNTEDQLSFSSEPGEGRADNVIEDVWKAMIDAALK